MKRVFLLLISVLLTFMMGTVIASAADHDHVPGEAVVEAEFEETCDDFGSYKYNYYCTICDKFLKFDRVRVPATGHDWTEGNCTTPETCASCGETRGEAPGHTIGEGVLEVEYEPTCEDDGSYKYNYNCTVCGKFLKFDRVRVPATGHDWKEATCTTPETCASCGETRGEALGHTIGEGVLEVEYEPTCKEEGSYKYNYYCTECGKFLKFDRVKVPATGHDWKEATMMDAAKCNNCGIKTGNSIFFQRLEEGLKSSYCYVKKQLAGFGCKISFNIFK